jgi:Thioredoxin
MLGCRVTIQGVVCRGERSEVPGKWEEAIVVTKERFGQGMTVAEYIAQMSMNKDRLLAALDSTALAPRDAQVLERFAATRRILVITEDWCGAAIASLPFVIKLAETVPTIETRIFLRDENADLMDQFLKDGRYRSIPVFVFLDEDMQELARFIERRPA